MTPQEMQNSASALWFGLFIEKPFTGDLANEIEHQHITFGYKVTPPDGIDWEAEYPIVVIGYANDGTNEGYCCEFPPELDEMYFGTDMPHITVSVSDDGKPVNTQYLDFEELDEPFTIYGKFGYYARGNYYI